MALLDVIRQFSNMLPATSEAAELMLRMEENRPTERRLSSNAQTLSEELKEYFKDSPWELKIQKLGNKEWLVWQRVYGLKGTDQKEKSEVIFLEPLDDGLEINEHYSPATGTSIILIKTSKTSSSVTIDRANNVLIGDKESSVCKYPQYLIIPQKAQDLGRELVFNNSKYDLVGLYTNGDGEGEKGNADFWMLHESTPSGAYPGLLRALNFKCKAGELESYTVLEKDAKPTSKNCVILDASGSMSTFAKGTMIDAIADGLSEQFDSLYKNAIFFNNSPGFINLSYTKGKILKEIVSLKLFAVNGEERSFGDNIISAAIFLKAQEFENTITRLNSHDIELEEMFAVELVDRKEVKKWVEKAIDERLGEMDAFKGSNANDETIKRIKDECSQIYSYFTDTHGSYGTFLPSLMLYIRTSPIFPETAITLESAPVKTSADTPLFIEANLLDYSSRYIKDQTVLLEDPDSFINNMGSVSEEALYNWLLTIKDSAASQRDTSFNIIKEALMSPRFDGHVKKRAIAIMANWALKGDDKAKNILKGLFKAPPSGLNGEIMGYLAKSASLFISDEEAKTLADKIRTDKTSGLNYYFLTALEGKKEFGEILRFFFDEVWNRDLVMNDTAGNMIQSFEAVFVDPIRVIQGPDAKRLAGINWRIDTFKKVLSALRGGEVPVLTEIKDRAASYLYNYAIAFLDPPWEKGDRILLNEIPEKRYWYKKPMVDVEKELQTFALTASAENSWTYINSKEGGVLIEKGIMSTADSTFIKVDWKFFDEVLKDNGIGNGPLDTIDFHIHPPYDVSMPENLLTVPSSTDLLGGFFSALYNLRKRYPGTKIEFRIVSPSGITVVEPKENIYSYIDHLIDEGKRPTVPYALGESVRRYEEYLQKNPEFIDLLSINSYLTGYYKITLPKGEK